MQQALIGGFTRLAQMPAFRREHTDLTPWQVIGWWEARRVSYNILVGLVGMFSGAVMLVTAFVCEKIAGVAVGMPDPPVAAVFGIFAYGVLANVCFTGGWVAELLVTKVWRERSGAFAEMALLLGVVFSVLLTLLPAVLTVLAGAITLALHYAGLPIASND